MLEKKVCPEAKEIRVKRENFWMKELRTLFPYGLNERARGQDHSIPTGKLFLSISRHFPRIVRFRNHQTNNNLSDVNQFFLKLELFLASYLSNALYIIRTILNAL